jgi:hypothetical protein
VHYCQHQAKKGPLPAAEALFNYAQSRGVYERFHASALNIAHQQALVVSQSPLQQNSRSLPRMKSSQGQTIQPFRFLSLLYITTDTTTSTLPQRDI